MKLLISKTVNGHYRSTSEDLDRSRFYARTYGKLPRIGVVRESAANEGQDRFIETLMAQRTLLGSRPVECGVSRHPAGQLSEYAASSLGSEITFPIDSAVGRPRLPVRPWTLRKRPWRSPASRSEGNHRLLPMGSARPKPHQQGGAGLPGWGTPQQLRCDV